jgi:cytochrome c oxidase subunit 2
MTRQRALGVASTGLAFIASLLAVASSPARAQDEPRVVAITARRFEFSPNQITLAKGETVKLRIRSEDVTHGLFLRPLGIDTEIVPGQVTELTVTPQAAGTYRAICDHFCGAGHGGMKMTIVVEEPAAHPAADR